MLYEQWIPTTATTATTATIEYTTPFAKYTLIRLNEFGCFHIYNFSAARQQSNALSGDMAEFSS